MKGIVFSVAIASVIGLIILVRFLSPPAIEPRRFKVVDVRVEHGFKWALDSTDVLVLDSKTERATVVLNDRAKAMAIKSGTTLILVTLNGLGAATLGLCPDHLHLVSQCAIVARLDALPGYPDLPGDGWRIH